MDISAVVISYQSERFLEGCLQSLMAQTVPFQKIVAIDNHSTDRSPAIIQGFPAIESLRLERNLGYARTANLGIRRCDSDLILVANADTIFAADFNRQVLDFFFAHPHADLLSPLILRFDGETVDSAGQECSWAFYPAETGYNRKKEKTDLRQREVFSVCGAATVFSAKALSRLETDGEYYDEDFFMFWEDFDIGCRAQRYGLKVFFSPRPVVRHFRSGTMEKNRISRFFPALARPSEIKYHLVKNRYLTLIKNFRFRRFWRTIPGIICKDLFWIPALTISSPKIIIRLMKSGPLFRKAFLKRKIINRHA